MNQNSLSQSGEINVRRQVKHDKVWPWPALRIIELCPPHSTAELSVLVSRFQKKALLISTSEAINFALKKLLHNATVYPKFVRKKGLESKLGWVRNFSTWLNLTFRGGWPIGLSICSSATLFGVHMGLGNGVLYSIFLDPFLKHLFSFFGNEKSKFATLN